MIQATGVYRTTGCSVGLAFADPGIGDVKHAFGLAPDGTVWHRSQTTPGTWPPP